MLKRRTMRHVTVQLLTEELPKISLQLADTEVFNPDPRPLLEEELPEIPGENYRTLYKQAQARLGKITRYVELPPCDTSTPLEAVSESELDVHNEWLGGLWNRLSELEEERHRILEARAGIIQLEESLQNFSALNIDLGLLQGGRGFLDIHIGTTPRSRVEQLSDALGLAGYVLHSYGRDDKNSQIIILGLAEHNSEELQAILEQADFRRLVIPEEFRDSPDTIRQQLEERHQALDAELQALEPQFDFNTPDIMVLLCKIRMLLRSAAPYVELGNAARSQGGLSVIHGWTPSDHVKCMEKFLREHLDTPFLMHSRRPTPEERAIVPSAMTKSRWLKPFSILVKQYGIPRYGEADPTPLFALSFILMFGIMFGDVGHGAVILVAGLLARHKLRSFTLFAVLAGISSIIFGFLYGSIFGYEHVLHAIWIQPLSDPLYMLSVALAWGVGFIFLISLINIQNLLWEGDRLGALLGTNGALSLTLYLSLLWGGYNFYTSGSFGTLAALLMFASLVALFAFKLLAHEAPIGERILVALIETFEAITGYLSNTLSFLRVAAFSLNHVALAIAVFTLAEMMDQTGHMITVILGNVFILVLEGAIVTIQVLRLEYYEGFSRFYRGDGKPFTPLRIKP